MDNNSSGESKLLKKFIWIYLSLFFISSLQAAVEVPAIPSKLNPFSLEPGLIANTLAKQPTGIPQTMPASPGHPNESQAPIEPSEAEKISFVLNGVIFSGNHVFSDKELQTIFSPSIHHKITLARFFELTQEVTEKYQKAGYFLSKAIIPPQEINHGIVKVRILEGFISEVQFQGVKGNNLGMLQKYGEAIKSVKPIRLADLERTLLLINDISGFQVKSVIAPDQKTPLGSTLTLVTTYRPVQATATYDNYQTRYLGPNEGSIYSSINSGILPLGTLYGRALGATQINKLQYYELRQDQPIGTDGLVISADGYYTRTNPQFILAPLDVFGYSGDGNLTASYPLIRSRNRTLRMQGQFNYMNTHSTVLGALLYYDKIRDFSLAAQYNDIKWKGEDSLVFSIDKGFNIFGANDKGFRSRLGASSDYLKLNLTIARDQFLNQHFSVYGLVTSQYANKPLLTAEVFIFGGPYLGRGYDMAQFTGDEGVAGKLELRMNTSLNLPLSVLKQIQWYLFYDAGKLWSLIEGANPSDTSGASAGFGARTAILPHFNAEGFFGRPLTTPNATQVILHRNGHAFLGYFQLAAYF